MEFLIKGCMAFQCWCLRVVTVVDRGLLFYQIWCNTKSFFFYIIFFKIFISKTPKEIWGKETKKKKEKKKKKNKKKKKKRKRKRRIKLRSQCLEWVAWSQHQVGLKTDESARRILKSQHQAIRKSQRNLITKSSITILKLGVVNRSPKLHF